MINIKQLFMFFNLIKKISIYLVIVNILTLGNICISYAKINASTSIVANNFGPNDYNEKENNIDNMNQKKSKYHNINKLKIGLLLHSNLVHNNEVDRVINFIINKNVFTQYKVSSSQVNCSLDNKPKNQANNEFSRQNFIKFTKNTNKFISSIEDLVAQEFNCNRENNKKKQNNNLEKASNNNTKISKTQAIQQETLRRTVKNLPKHYMRDIIDALNQDDIRILMSIRGGYGASDLLEDLLNLQKPEGKEKLFIGFSDATILHLFLSQKWNWKTIHGPVLLSAEKTSHKNFQKLVRLLLSKYNSEIEISLKPINKIAKNINDIEDSLVTGGNLCVIQTSIGTKIQIDAKNKILIIEETKESIYKVKRMLKHLKDTGVLESASAIIIGTIDCGEEIKMPAMLQNLIDDLEVPVFYTNKIGHNEYNYPFIINEIGSIIKQNSKYIFKQTFKNIYLD